MLRKFYLSIQPKRIKKVGIFSLLANTFMFTLIFSLAAMTVYAQGYYYPNSASSYSYSPNSYFQPSYSTPSYSTPSYSTPSYSTPSYSTPSYSTPSYSTPSYSQPSYYLNTSGYSTNYATPAQGYYYNGNSNPSNTNSTGYTTQSSFYNPTSYGTLNSNPTSYGTSSSSYYSPSTYSTATQGYYNPATSYNTGATSSTTPYASNSSSYYAPATATTSYYNNPYYRTAGSSTYYPTAQTYYPAATGYTTGYTTNATITPTDASGEYQGTWARNYSSTGAQTVGRTSNGGSMRSLYDIVRSSNSTSTTATTCGGMGSGSGNGGGGAFLPITLDLTQTAAAVNGAVTFFAEDNAAKTIPVTGTIDSSGVLNLIGTTTGDVADPASYGLKITATVKTSALKGAYTLTNSITDANIELGTFSASR
jgi:hypothetical protein